MSFPEQLQSAIEQEASRFTLQEMLEARRRLTERYRQRDERKLLFMRTPAERCAYMAARMPATYAACSYVFHQLLQCVPAAAARSSTILDVGAGPGTASWAAAGCFSSLQQITLLEQDGELIALGKKLMAGSFLPILEGAEWRRCHLDGEAELPVHDIVICSYSIGELPEAQLLPFVRACWSGTREFCIMIEPGTPLGFERLAAVRQELIDMGGQVIAPCTHENTCPLMAGREGEKQPRWCHFARRIDRSFLHAHIKEGSLGFEDEKFSYLIFAKSRFDRPSGRLLASPRKHSGHMTLELCTNEGEKVVTVSKRTPELYKKARKLNWGDTWDGN